jgi:hypothetical protein
MPKLAKNKPYAVYHYFRVVVTFTDGEVSAHKVYKDEAKARKYADRVGRSKVVKSAKIVPFDNEPHNQEHMKRRVTASRK